MKANHNQLLNENECRLVFINMSKIQYESKSQRSFQAGIRDFVFINMSKIQYESKSQRFVAAATPAVSFYQYVKDTI